MEMTCLVPEIHHHFTSEAISIQREDSLDMHVQLPHMLRHALLSLRLWRDLQFVQKLLLDLTLHKSCSRY